MDGGGPVGSDGAGPAKETVVVGLGGSKTLVTAIKDTVKRLEMVASQRGPHGSPRGRVPLRHVLTVARHGFSVGQHVAHNVKIEPGGELDFYRVLERARADSPHTVIRTFTQTSFDGAAPVSRLCGIQMVDGAGPHAPFVPIATTDSKNVMDCAQGLCKAVEAAQCPPGPDGRKRSLGWELKRLLGMTEARKGFQGTFLHDAKVYFAAACYDGLMEAGVLSERQLSIMVSPDGVEFVIDAVADAAHRGTVVTDVLVAPGQALEFHRRFVAWLEDDNRHAPPVAAVVADPGCGHTSRAVNWLVAQDCDDAAALLLMTSINRLFLCDETPVQSRAAAAVALCGPKVDGVVPGIPSPEVQVPAESAAMCTALADQVVSAVTKRDGAEATLLDEAFCTVGQRRLSGGDVFDPIAASHHALERMRSPTAVEASSICSAIDAAEADAVLRQCFVPTLEQLDALIAQSRRAESDLREGRLTKLLSKLPHVAALCPPSMNPGDTILVKLARAHGRVGDNLYRAIQDQALVYWTSFGPNSVYLEPDDDVRINLVSHSRGAIADMLDAYFAVRSAWLPAIIKMLPDKIRECRMEGGGYSKHFPPKMDAEGNVDTVPEAWWPAYDAVADMLDAVGIGLRRALWWAGPDAAPQAVLRRDLGLELVSLCQTWMRGSGAIGDAEFSVMSPHFQNRLVVVDASKLMATCGLSVRQLEAYHALGVQFAANMEAAGYSGPKGGAFMHLDQLRQLL